MPLILHLETATAVCSVVLARNGEVVAFRERNDRNIHASYLTVFIEEVLAEAGIAPADLSAVAVSMGPGSYTGLRIGVSAAKGLCYGLDIPLISVNTLEAMASGLAARKEYAGDVLYCPMIDARRMEVYAGIFDHTQGQKLPVGAYIVEPGIFDPFLDNHKVVFFGDGAEKCRPAITHPNAIFNTEAGNTALNLCIPALKKYEDQVFEDVAYFEPFYLKDFIAGGAAR
jgi:tRNA threonylcarbamoyladenosine biosynthesis protein TsaB